LAEDRSAYIYIYIYIYNDLLLDVVRFTNVFTCLLTYLQSNNVGLFRFKTKSSKGGKNPFTF